MTLVNRIAVDMISYVVLPPCQLVCPIFINLQLLQLDMYMDMYSKYV